MRTVEYEVMDGLSDRIMICTYEQGVVCFGEDGFKAILSGQLPGVWAAPIVWN